MTTKNIPRVSFTVMEKHMTQMLRFKVKTTPNKTTVRKMLQALFLQHFNGFILHGTFVVCQEIYIIFSKINFFPLEYCKFQNQFATMQRVKYLTAQTIQYSVQESLSDSQHNIYLLWISVSIYKAHALF